MSRFTLLAAPCFAPAAWFLAGLAKTLLLGELAATGLFWRIFFLIVLLVVSYAVSLPVFCLLARYALGGRAGRFATPTMAIVFALAAGWVFSSSFYSLASASGQCGMALLGALMLNFAALLWLQTAMPNDAAPLDRAPHPLAPALSQGQRVRNAHDEIKTSSCRINKEDARREPHDAAAWLAGWRSFSGFGKLGLRCGLLAWIAASAALIAYPNRFFNETLFTAMPNWSNLLGPSPGLENLLRLGFAPNLGMPKMEMRSVGLLDVNQANLVAWAFLSVGILCAYATMAAVAAKLKREDSLDPSLGLIGSATALIVLDPLSGSLVLIGQSVVLTMVSNK